VAHQAPRAAATLPRPQKVSELYQKWEGRKEIFSEPCLLKQYIYRLFFFASSTRSWSLSFLRFLCGGWFLACVRVFVVVVVVVGGVLVHVYVRGFGGVRVCGRGCSGAAFSGGSVLLYGPPGTGKTTLARACARATGATLIELRAPDVVHGTGTGKDVYKEALACATPLVFCLHSALFLPGRNLTAVAAPSLSFSRQSSVCGSHPLTSPTSAVLVFISFCVGSGHFGACARGGVRSGAPHRKPPPSVHLRTTIHACSILPSMFLFCIRVVDPLPRTFLSTPRSWPP
jgi:hypothetical protein